MLRMSINALPLVTFALHLYEAVIQAILNIFSGALTIFNDRMILLIDHSSDKRVYIFPLLHLHVSTDGLHFSSLDDTNCVELATVKFIKNGKVQSKISKNESPREMKEEIKRVSHVDLDKIEREYMKRFVFVELGGSNISRYFYQVGWSLNDAVQVKDLQKILRVHGNDVTLDFTDDDLAVEQRHPEQTVLSQVHADLTKRS